MIDQGNPEHYQNQSLQPWEMMLKIWGKEAFIKHCEMTAFKYRMRVGYKHEDNDPDIIKAKWYEQKAKELKTQVEMSGIYEVTGDGSNHGFQIGEKVMVIRHFTNSIYLCDSKGKTGYVLQKDLKKI